MLQGMLNMALNQCQKWYRAVLISHCRLLRGRSDILGGRSSSLGGRSDILGGRSSSLGGRSDIYTRRSV